MSAARLLLPRSASRDQWLSMRSHGIGASEIAAVLGISNYQSAFDLFWRKVHPFPDDDFDNERMYWGRALEQALADRFDRDHDEFVIRRTGLWQSRRRRWQLATPDRLICDGPGGRTPVAVWEGKTAGSFDGWGDQWTDDIPVAYRSQVLQQLDVIGVDVAYVSVLVSGNTYREYVVTRHDVDVEVMRRFGDAFWARVEDARADPAHAAMYEPDIDAHPATTSRLRAMHPAVENRAVTVPATIVRQRQLAKRLRDTAQQRMDLADNRLRHLMGTAKYAIVDGVRAATRTVYDQKRVDLSKLRADEPGLVSIYTDTKTMHRFNVTTKEIPHG